VAQVLELVQVQVQVQVQVLVLVLVLVLVPGLTPKKALRVSWHVRHPQLDPRCLSPPCCPPVHRSHKGFRGR
jgi:hypothetical protein